jgi:acylphosphatase
MGKWVRAHLLISGRVQGVCFRLETERTAVRLNVSGWVRNRPDGTVEAVLEGNVGNVEEMLSWCQQGPPLSRVDHVDVSWEVYSGKYTGFDITL